VTTPSCCPTLSEQCDAINSSKIHSSASREMVDRIHHRTNRHVNLALLSYPYNKAVKTTPHCSICGIVRGRLVCGTVLCVFLIRDHVIIISRDVSKAAFVVGSCRNQASSCFTSHSILQTQASIVYGARAYVMSRRAATSRHRYGVITAHNPMAGIGGTWSNVKVRSVIAVCVYEYSAMHTIKPELMLDLPRS